MEQPVAPPIDKSYGVFGTLAITVGVFFSGQFLGSLLAGLMLGVIALMNGWSSAQTTEWLHTTWAVFLSVGLIELVTIVLLGFFLKQRGISFQKLGLSRLKLSYLGYILVGFGLYIMLYLTSVFLLEQLVPGLDLDQEQDLGFSTETTGNALILIFISLVILAPLVEEIVMRGFLFGGLRKNLSFWIATMITSGLFALAHLPGAKEGLLWIGALDTFMLSIVLCFLREKTGSLWPSVGVHAMKNGLAFIVLFNILR